MSGERAGRPKVIISNGYSKFEVAFTAEEAERAGRLERYLTGAYPTAFWRNALRATSGSRAIARFLARATRLPEDKITSVTYSEFLYLLALSLPSFMRHRFDLMDRLLVASFQFYGVAACKAIATASPNVGIYHYRSGFGGRSVGLAREKGMVLLCEHSIAHPLAVDYLIAHGGCLPEPGHPGPISRFWKYIADDIAPSDYVVANSDFVKKTMVAMGHTADRVFVLYRGVDDEFIATLDGGSVPPRCRSDGPLRLLFAGSFTRRKGAQCLSRALEYLEGTEGWTISIVGPVDHDCRAEYEKLSSNKRVRLIGPLLRVELAAAMRQADVFVFPTLAEGSARVAFEALAAGCYVVTTENCGSIVGRDAEGVLVEPENPAMLAEVLAKLIAEPGRAVHGGELNATLIRRSYRQSAYGAKLLDMYDKICRVGRS